MGGEAAVSLFSYRATRSGTPPRRGVPHGESLCVP
jgi:hypothetical protein